MSKKLMYLIIPIVLILLLMGACSSAATQTPEGDSIPTSQPVEPTQPVETEAPTPTEAAQETEEPTPTSVESITVIIDNDEGPITPANFNTFIGYWMVGWIYDPLFIRNPDLEVIPALATSATPSEDGLTWEITLRDDVSWHDGEPFTAEDVAFSYNFLIEAGRANNLSAVESVEATSDYSISITLKNTDPFFYEEGLTSTYILPEHIWRDQEPVSGELSQFQGQIGTGAYRLDTIEPGEYYIFKANPDYFRGEPLVPEIVTKIVKDRTQQFNQLRTGEADAVLSSVPPAFVAELGSNPDLAIAQGSDFFNYIYYTNGSRPPFDDQQVRQAIAKAIDSETLVRVVLLEQGVQLPMSWYHPDLPWSLSIESDFNPEEAAMMLDEAGLTDSDGDGIREFEGENTNFEILCDVNNPVEVRSTELIVGWLEDVGINASQNCLDIDTEVTLIWPNFVSIPNPDYDMSIWGWSSGTQFQRRFLRFLAGCDFGGIAWGNLSGLCDPELDALLEEFAVNPDPVRQEELNSEIQTRFAEFLPFIPLMSPGGNFAYRPQNFDNWQYMRGTGIMTVWSFLPPEAAASGE